MEGHSILNRLICLGLSLILLIAFLIHPVQQITFLPAFWMIFWLALALILSFFLNRLFVLSFLSSLFCMVIAWRISGLYALHWVVYPLFIVFFLYVADFFCAVNQNRHAASVQNRLTPQEWQLTFIRLYIGLDLIPHFTEKLFAGALPRLLDVNAFTLLHVPDPAFFVILAGICEFIGAISFVLGFFLRMGAIFTAVYLFIATWLGHHFLLGFIWAGKGGGYEFPLLWMAMILSFAVVPGQAFSLDTLIKTRFNLPFYLKKLL